MAKRNERKTIENAFLGEDLEVRFITLEGVLSRMEARVAAAQVAMKPSGSLKDIERRVRILERQVPPPDRSSDLRELFKRVDRIEKAIGRAAEDIGTVAVDAYDYDED